jgi:hypothetical protein
MINIWLRFERVGDVTVWKKQSYQTIKKKAPHTFKTFVTTKATPENA